MNANLDIRKYQAETWTIGFLISFFSKLVDNLLLESFSDKWVHAVYHLIN